MNTTRTALAAATVTLLALTGCSGDAPADVDGHAEVLGALSEPYLAAALPTHPGADADLDLVNDELAALIGADRPIRVSVVDGDLVVDDTEHGCRTTYAPASAPQTWCGTTPVTVELVTEGGHSVDDGHGHEEVDGEVELLALEAAGTWAGSLLAGVSGSTGVGYADLLTEQTVTRLLAGDLHAGEEPYLLPRPDVDLDVVSATADAVTFSSGSCMVTVHPTGTAPGDRMVAESLMCS